MLDLFDTNENEWIMTLPKYQQDTIKELLINQNAEAVANTWLTASTQNTSPFSAQKEDTNAYLDLIKKEVNKLLCGNPEYEEERKELSQIMKSEKNKTLLVSSISGVIGSKVGLAATFIAPVTVLLFITITKISINAWCELQKENEGLT